MTPHLLVAISSHGYGHLSQIAPVINALRVMSDQALVPGFDLTIRSALPPAQITKRVTSDFTLDAGSDDFGMVMHDALHVDLIQSLRQYATLHTNWPLAVNRLADHLASLDLTGVVADAPYLTLAAAQAAGIPCVGVCSLNWADILEQCVARQPGALGAADVSPHTLARILQQIRQAYACAQVIVRPEPALETRQLQTLTIDPIAPATGTADRDGLLKIIKAQLEVQHETDLHNAMLADKPCWIVLTSMGGIDLPLDPRLWPTQCLGRRVVYLMANDTVKAGPLACPHIIAMDFEGIGFEQLMASCDLVLTKPGYGMFVEARTCCKPILYLARDEWPESPCLEQWASTYADAIKLSSEQLSQGRFRTELEQLLTLPTQPHVTFDGARQAARLIASELLSQLRI